MVMIPSETLHVIEREEQHRRAAYARERDELAAAARHEIAKRDAEIERLRAALRCEAESGTCFMVHNPERDPCTPENCRAMRALEQSEDTHGYD